jgi:predicted transcriptional regulator
MGRAKLSVLANYLLPKPTFAGKKAINDFAEAAATKFGYKPGGSIEAIVVRLGGTIEHLDPLDADSPDSICVEGRRSFKIFISSYTSSQRDRFTIAHELGHYILHYPVLIKTDPLARMKATRWVDESNSELVRAEWEANWFAAGFLMPTAEFSEKLESGNLSSTASYFGVSESAAKVRAQSLELL